MNKKFESIALGQGQGPKAARLIENGQQIGGWVMLANCHLAISWMPALEMLVQQFNPESMHHNFRLWLTSMPSKDFPVQVRCRRSSGRGTDSLRHYVRRLPFLEQSYMELSS